MSTLPSAIPQEPVSYPLSIKDLYVDYAAIRGRVQAVRSVSFDLHPNENLALVGESGCGKTTLGLALIRLLAKSAVIRKGEITYRRDLQAIQVLELSETEIRHFRWKECAMVFQSALNAFNPVLTVWQQINDTFKAHPGILRKTARLLAHEILSQVQLDPDRVIDAYPHTLSGGMRQRVLLAMSLLLHPQVLILDEPTTALDILTQRTILDLLKRLKEELGFSMIFITHDLTIAAELADRVATMYAGALVELAPVEDFFYRPAHPYTLGLIRAVPTVTGKFQDLVSIAGAPPDLVTLPHGCTFHPRCPFAEERCQKEEPPLIPLDARHSVACFFYERTLAEAESRPNSFPIQEGGA